MDLQLLPNVCGQWKAGQHGVPSGMKMSVVLALAGLFFGLHCRRYRVRARVRLRWEFFDAISVEV